MSETKGASLQIPNKNENDKERNVSATVSEHEDLSSDDKQVLESSPKSLTTGDNGDNTSHDEAASDMNEKDNRPGEHEDDDNCLDTNDTYEVTPKNPNPNPPQVKRKIVPPPTLLTPNLPGSVPTGDERKEMGGSGDNTNHDEAAGGDMSKDDNRHGANEGGGNCLDTENKYEVTPKTPSQPQVKIKKLQPPTLLTPDLPGKAIVDDRIQKITPRLPPLPPPLAQKNEKTAKSDENDDNHRNDGVPLNQNGSESPGQSQQTDPETKSSANVPARMSPISKVAANLIARKAEEAEIFEDEPLEDVDIEKTRKNIAGRVRQHRIKRDKDKRSFENDVAMLKTDNSDGVVSEPIWYNNKVENNTNTNNLKTPANMNATGAAILSSGDIEIWGKLDEEYEKALEERDIGYKARYTSVRQAAGLAVLGMIFYLTVGTTFTLRNTEWEFHEALFFSIYTITTAGYGNYDMPRSTPFQLFTIVYMFVGIALLTIMVAQVYQFLALEATRAQHAREKTDLSRQASRIMDSNDSLRGNRDAARLASRRTTGILDRFHLSDSPESPIGIFVDRIVKFIKNCKRFFRETEIGRSISVVFPFAGLITIGAIVVGPIEGWTVIEALYFSAVSLTTVGYGNYVPEKKASIWFCILWLPFSVGFMSLFLGNVAAFYIRLSDKNIRRIERSLRLVLEREKEYKKKDIEEARKRAFRGQEQAERGVGSDDGDIQMKESSMSPSRRPAGARSRGPRQGFDFLPEEEDIEDSDEGEDSGNNFHFGLSGSPRSKSSYGLKHRELVLAKSQFHSNEDSNNLDPSSGPTLQTMQDVIRTVKKNLMEGEDDFNTPEARFMSLRRNQSTVPVDYFRRKSMLGTPQLTNRPSFAMRALVQERFALIIAAEVAGYQSHIDIHETTLSVNIDSLNSTADKWMVPRRARKAFREVCFQALYFVGERGLIIKGAEVLFELSPIEFHGLFSPLLAALGDAETMDAWLASTEVLADVDLPKDPSRQSPEKSRK